MNIQVHRSLFISVSSPNSEITGSKQMYVCFEILQKKDQIDAFLEKRIIKVWTNWSKVLGQFI